MASTRVRRLSSPARPRSVTAIFAARSPPPDSIAVVGAASVIGRNFVPARHQTKTREWIKHRAPTYLRLGDLTCSLDPATTAPGRRGWRSQRGSSHEQRRELRRPDSGYGNGLI